MGLPPVPDEAYAQIANETRGHYLVGMDPVEFLDNFLPWNENTPTHYQQQVVSETRENNLKSVPPVKGARHPERSMYKHYVDALDDWVTGIDNSQRLRFAHFKKPDVDCASLNVGVSTYWQSDFPSVPSKGSCAFSLQQTQEEFRVDHTYDAFAHVNDEKPNTENPHENAAGEEDPSNSASAEDVSKKSAKEANKPASSVDVVDEIAGDAETLNEDLGDVSEESAEHAPPKDSHHDHVNNELLNNKYPFMDVIRCWDSSISTSSANSTGNGAGNADKPASSLSVVNIKGDSESSEEGARHAPSKDSQHELKEDAKQPPVVETADTSKQSAGSRSLVSEVEKDTQRAIRTRGQIAAYAGVAMSMAFRTHFFSLLILGGFARFIRWDRRGAVVSTRFNYIERPHLIFGFYLRFGQLSLRQRGFDTNAVRVPTQMLPDDVASAFDKYYERSWHEGAKFSHHKNNVDGRPRRSAKESNFYRVTVNDSAINQTEAYFVPAPIYRPSIINPFTRGSRRSLAFVDLPDKSERKMCFMKDSWQEDSARTAPEADIYRRLHEHGVPNIASMRLGDDVADMKTETQEWWGRLNHSGRFKRFGFGFMVCHRLVLNTVARDLSTFTWCKVLLSCLADVVDAAQAAFKAGVLHRDISASNIMIVMDKETKEWRGVLIDWDMCLLLEKREKHLQKTGTWGFISARILQARSSEPVVMHSLGDDMESIFWVLVYQVLRYTRHNHSPEQLHKQMDSLFNDMTITENKEVIGGSQKVCTILACSIRRVDIALGRFNISRLRNVFATIGQEFHPRYYEPPAKGGLGEHLNIERPPAPVSTVDWDSPDDKWFSTFLRREAEGMQPLGITPTALESPSNDSKPPVDPALWKRARISRYPPDFFEMPQCSAKDVYNLYKKDKGNSNEDANNKVVTSSRLNYMDGLSASASKRPLEVDEEEKDEDEDEGHERDGAAQPRAKRQRLL